MIVVRLIVLVVIIVVTTVEFSQPADISTIGFARCVGPGRFELIGPGSNLHMAGMGIQLIDELSEVRRCQGQKEFTLPAIAWVSCFFAFSAPYGGMGSAQQF